MRRRTDEGFAERRAGQILRRVRVFSRGLALLMCVWAPIDWLSVPSDTAQALTMLRATVGIGLFVLAQRAQSAPSTLREARIALALFFAEGWVFVVLAAAATANELPLTSQGFVLVALAIGGGVFPLSWREGIVVQAGAAVAGLVFLQGQHVGAVAYWILAALVVIPLWQQHVQYHTLAHFYRAVHTDALTGLKNRGYMEQQMNGRDVSVLLIDVDHFKRVNDQWGHAAGDQVLQHIAEVLKRNVRMGDTVGRIGGEEFLFLLAETDVNGAWKIAERLREQVEKSTSPIPVQVTISVGVALHAAGEESADTLKRADKALYQAKDDGRNRVVVADVPRRLIEHQA